MKLQHVRSGLQVDLFVVRPPAQWGVLYLIRTGPAAYSRRFVTDLHSIGWHVAEGALHRGGGLSDRDGWHAPFGCPDRCEAIATPEEGDVYATIGRPMPTPADRDRLVGA